MNPKEKSLRKPKNWYSFRWSCPLHEYRMTNMVSEEERHDCKRKDRKGNERARCELFSCTINVCPVLKGKIEMNERQKEAMVRGEYE